MFRSVLAFILVCICLTTIGYADDLYKVVIKNPADADKLIASGAEALVLIREGYLVLADETQADFFKSSGLVTQLLDSGVEKHQLALDNRPDELNVDRFQTLYVDGGFRLFNVGDAETARDPDGARLIPIRNEYLTVKYHEPKFVNDEAIFQSDGLQEVIDLVEYDSVSAFIHTLQAFNGRLTGTASGYASRDWIRNQFISFGYTDAELDPFMGAQLWSYDPVNSYNVVARKTGTRYPNRQIVIGAHYDAVPGSPGADDNGSGTTGVLEIARVLADIETEMTLVFVTFDSEESGLHGAWTYASRAASDGDSIICMLNMDMIGDDSNDDYASIHYGPEMAYAELWIRLADSLVGIEGILSGASSHSDHYPFTQMGYDVAYASEYIFSGVYHTYQDSTTYMNLDYMTRMIKGVLATAYAVGNAPSPPTITLVRDGGDGQSLQVNWVGSDDSYINHYTVFYDTEPSTGLNSVNLPAGDSSVMLAGLTQGQLYRIHVIAYDSDGDGSVIYTLEYGTPNIIPAAPESLTARPVQRAIELKWEGNNTELDFSHYLISRDGQILPELITDTFYVDDDFTLGSDFHSYYVMAQDNDGNISDTVGLAPTVMAAATLQPGRILAVNRSARQSSMITNEVTTGEFMRDALDGYNFEYYSDTAHGGSTSDTFRLIDMLDYELVIFGAESGRSDDLGANPIFGGILDSIGYYLSIGGKVIVFGRWGELYTTGPPNNEIVFSPGDPDYGYNEFFHMSSRTQVLSTFTPTTINSQLVGASNIVPFYPSLTWDSLASADHSYPWGEVTGIPCPSHINYRFGPEPIYTAVTRDDSAYLNEKVMAWRYLGEDYKYVFFEIPLSFMERSSAKAALQAAVSDLISQGEGAFAIEIDSDTIDVPAGVPSTVTLYLGDFRSGMTASDVDLSAIMVNLDIVPLSTSILSSHPDIIGEVVEIVVDGNEFAQSYGALLDTTETIYALTWNFTGNPFVNFNSGTLTVIPEMYLGGDANGDGAVNVGDAVYMINYVFKGGASPDPMAVGDPNGDCSPNVGDAVYLINYIFKGGTPPIINPECEW